LETVLTILHLDDETRSACDLKAAGLANYAADPTTGLWCSAFAFDGDKTELWTPEGNSDDGAVRAAKEHIRRGGLVYAHNAAFEFEIGRQVAPRYGWPAPSLDQLRCTMSMALAMGLPASLEHCAAALGIDQQKDMKGSRVMLQLSKPRKTIVHTPEHDGATGWIEHVWWDDPTKIQTLYDYCRQDVEVERACHARMLELSDDEQQLWKLYQRMNQRGIPVDLDSIDKAMRLVESERQRLDDEMRAVTGNVVAGCTDVAQLTAWLRYRGSKSAQMAGIEISEMDGFRVVGVAKADLAELLESPNLPPDCRRALELRQEAAKSSTAKLKAMRNGASADGRVRGCVQHHGAHTGRSAGRRVQPLNMPRPSLLKHQPDVEDVLAHLDQPQCLDVMYGAPMTLLSDCLRGVICAPEGREFVCCDFSNIEGRVLAWLAGEDWKIQAFKDFDAGTGPDLYLLAYAKAFGCTIEEAMAFRQVGKVMELALGYEGGVGAFQTMARGYGVKVRDARAEELKQAWRKAHPATGKLWKGLIEAAIRAVRDGGKHEYRGILYRKMGSFLFCRLRSGRVLSYAYPQLERGKFDGDALSYMCVNSVSRKWERHHTYGGDLTNHVTQATARDIQTHGMLNVEEYLAAQRIDGGVVLEVYDETVIEVPVGALTVDVLATLLSNAPHWASGLPVVATGWSGRRYRKD
jgi:DNA polymerase bacteriophage-type